MHKKIEMKDCFLSLFNKMKKKKINNKRRNYFFIVEIET
jgi:hypothetical protein